MSNKFPTYLKSNNTGDIGVNIVSQVVNDEMKFIFKRNDAEYDFGIDAYIEIITETGAVTGQVIGVQIKCGKSFFKTKTKTGYTFYGENKHLNYYCNAPFPVIIAICDPETRKCYWQAFSIELTEKTDTAWKLNIPKRNELTENSKKALFKLVGEPVDFTEQANKEWEFVKTLKEAKQVHYSIPREHIETGKIKPLKSFFERILKNDDLAISLQGKVVISVDGYQYDKRELWDIRDVRRWVQRAEPKIKYWFFFCGNKNSPETLIFIMACLTNVKTVYKNPGLTDEIIIEYETKPLSSVIARNFDSQNELTERYAMTIDQCDKITEESMIAIGFDKEKFYQGN
ncbi:DUF4365 domain-containing protein [Pseudoalteromonas shioyasakiensis]|uniref:DUF4365 domain-containing protein n=1 Tax=Pseudoalteromonas shioyasakiensis TaxID=1190813 RepID=UPI00209632BB|nr:DUF4365 and DUF1817 domain-containing protein [Pseudoalteromonas shioyasakiensis]MCO6355826.1 DUF4365 domain-containing protein [Pseudoalteromonas shioyasakiensis]